MNDVPPTEHDPPAESASDVPSEPAKHVSADSVNVVPSEPARDAPFSPVRMTMRERRHRFLERYEERRERRERGEVSLLARPVRVTAGVLLILAGIAIGWLPGPGFVILAFPGALLIASEWRRAARLMDAAEHQAVPRLEALWARLRRRS